MKKKKVLFVGSFKKKLADGGVGGQMFASISLVNSRLSEYIDWTLIDTTSTTNLPVPFFRKIPRVLIRIGSFIYYILFKKFDYILIFSSNGWSFVEKGLMAILGKRLSGAVIVFAPRSGRLIKELKPPNNWYITLIFKSIDKLICQGKIWYDFFNGLFEKLDVELLIQKNWIDTTLYSKSQHSSDIITILFLGWIDRDKGVFDIINALKGVRNEKPNINFRCIIAGKGKDEIVLKEEIIKKNLENFVELPGWVTGKDKFDLINKSDIFLLPSYYEGMPNSLVEALISGLACIAYNVGGIPDMIDDNNGILIKKGDVVKLKESIINLILDDNLRKNYQIKAREYALKEHSLEKAINFFEQKVFN